MTNSEVLTIESNLSNPALDNLHGAILLSAIARNLYTLRKEVKFLKDSVKPHEDAPKYTAEIRNLLAKYNNTPNDSYFEQEASINNTYKAVLDRNESNQVEWVQLMDMENPTFEDKPLVQVTINELPVGITELQLSLIKDIVEPITYEQFEQYCADKKLEASVLLVKIFLPILM